MHVFLYSDAEHEYPCEEKVIKKPVNGEKRQYMCYAITDEDGKYKFPTVPYG